MEMWETLTSCTKLLLASVEPEKTRVKVSTRHSRNTAWISLGKLVTINDLTAFVTLQQPLKHGARQLCQHESWKSGLSSPRLDPHYPTPSCFPSLPAALKHPAPHNCSPCQTNVSLTFARSLPWPTSAKLESDAEGKIFPSLDIPRC